jgi:protein-S-isoprenylcysteine O-methyltransferase Ste14
MKLPIGLILIAVGYFLRVLAARKLGEDFKFQAIWPDRIVTTGIYRFMRHPAYLGGLLMILGFGLISAVLAVMILAFGFFFRRIKEEENVLKYHPVYKRYMKRIGIFWPKRRKE